MLFSTTTHTKPTTTQQENHQNTTTHTTTTTIKKIKDQRKSKNSKSQKRRSVRGSIKITQKIKITQRDQFVGSWRKGSGLPAKSKACGLKALDRWSIRGFVDRFVDQRSQRHDLRWRHDLGSLSLSLSLFAHEFRNGLKWKFWLKPISGSKLLKHTVNWKYFPKNLFFMRNQTLAFTEKYFRKWFEAKTNTILVPKLCLRSCSSSPHWILSRILRQNYECYMHSVF